MGNSKIGTKEATLLTLSPVIVGSILSLTTNLVANTKSATLINIVFVGIITLLLSLLIIRLFKNFPGSDIIDISEYLGGKLFKNILGFIFITYFLVTSSILLREFCEALKIVYYPMTSVIYVITFFIISVIIVDSLDFNASIKTNFIITILVLLSIVFLFVGNFTKFTFQRVFPILGNGLNNTFIIGLSNIYAFEGIVFLYFLPPLLKKPEDLKKVAIASIVLHIIYLLLAVSCTLFMFSFFTDVKDIMPLYSSARYLQFGTFFQRFEALFLLIWIAAFACYISIACKFSVLIFKKLSKIKNTKPIILPFAILLFGLSLLPKNYAYVKNFETSIYPYLIIGFIFIFCIVLLVFANLKKRIKNK